MSARLSRLKILLHKQLSTGGILNTAFLAIIIISIIFIPLNTFEIPSPYDRIAAIADTIIIIIFTIEYLLRLWVSDKDSDQPPTVARILHVISFDSIVDFIAIAPFYLPLMLPFDAHTLAVLRLFKLFRIFKLSRYTDAFKIIACVFRRKAYQLLSSIVVVLALMFTSSLLIYNIEHTAQPDIFSNVFSGIWWSIATLTGANYGDIYPITVPGRILSAVIALLGIGLVAVTTGIISTGFSEVLRLTDKRKKSTVTAAVVLTVSIGICAAIGTTDEPSVMLPEQPTADSTDSASLIVENIGRNDKKVIVLEIKLTTESADTSDTADTSADTAEPDAYEAIAIKHSDSGMTDELIDELENVAVFWSPTGRKMHLNPECRTFKLGYTFAGTLEQAKAVRNNGWCGTCSKGMTDELYTENKYATPEHLADCYTFDNFNEKSPAEAFK